MWGFFSVCLMGSFHTLSLQKAYSFYCPLGVTYGCDSIFVVFERESVLFVQIPFTRARHYDMLQLYLETARKERRHP